MASGHRQPDDLLIVEDNPGDMRLIKEAFSDAQYNITLHAVTSGEQASDFIYQRNEYENSPEPDGILLDWHLPKMNGGDFLSKITPEFAHITAVIMTGSEVQEEAIKSNSYPANAYLTKPSDPHEYVEAILSVY